MILDLGITKIEVPNADLVLPTMMVCVGREDEKEKIAVGPTMAKAGGTKFRRTLSVAFEHVAKGEDPNKVIERIFNTVLQRLTAKVRNTETRTIANNPAKLAELAYTGPNGLQLLAYLLIFANGEWMSSLMLSCLDDKKASKAAKAQFDTIAATIQPGSYFD